MFASGPFGPAELNRIRARLRLAMVRPCLHQLSTPFQNVRATIGALDLTTDGMPHRLFDDRVRESRNLLRPGLNVARKPWAVIGRPLVGSIHFSPETLFILLMTVRSAILENGLL